MIRDYLVLVVWLHDLLLDFLKRVETGLDKNEVFYFLAGPFLESRTVVRLNR